MVAPFVPRLCARYGQGRVAVAGLAVVAAGLLAVALVAHLPLLWPRFPGLVLVGIGSAATVPITTIALDAAGDRVAGAVSGLLGAAREFAGALGVALAALLVVNAAGYRAALLLAAAALAAAAWSARTLWSPDKAAKRTAHPADKASVG